MRGWATNKLTPSQQCLKKANVMNAALTAKLDHIKTALRAWIESDGERSQGDWKQQHEDSPCLIDSGGSDVALLYRSANASDNARFIALSSTLSRPAAEALLLAIEALEWVESNPDRSARTAWAEVKLSKLAAAFHNL